MARSPGWIRAGDLYADTTRLAEKVDAATTRTAERRLIGVCPDCLNERDEHGEPVRTPIYAAQSSRYAVCPECGAWLDLKRVRLEYLRSAGLMHITRTQADAARWIRENTGVNVTGKDLANWRSRGQNAIHAAHRPALLGVEHHGSVGLRAGSRRARRRRRLNVRRFRVTLSRVIGVSEKPVPSGTGFFRIRSPWMVGRAVEGTRLLGGQA